MKVEIPSKMSGIPLEQRLWINLRFHFKMSRFLCWIAHNQSIDRSSSCKKRDVYICHDRFVIDHIRKMCFKNSLPLKNNYSGGGGGDPKQCPASNISESSTVFPTMHCCHISGSDGVRLYAICLYCS